ncbi:LysR family transcriptional regulator [Vibrio sp. ZSDE26]|uniref:LysR family transcriptional regulator n=1 Tax=Vibrio amylolyticus TaxID=2847292 RepID=A0A9X1XGZ8_9VIBR|nr:LysR family transcriptional regulator [Vibrio amylolyticus]MCK6262977.1 LysR family transcriptional regulator [Vibrio amylolyticus]
MKLRQLEIFYAIMQAGTISGAAKNLHVSQPNVTRVLAHTESQLGFQLFERVKGRLVPTQEAKTLLPEAERIYQQLGKFRSLTNKVKKGSLHLRIGAPPILASALLSPVIALLCEDKDVSVELSTANRDELCQSLLKNELDVAVCFGDEAPSGIAHERLLTQDMLVLAPKSEAIEQEQSKEAMTLATLLESPLPLIGLDQRDPLGQLLHHAISRIDPHYHHQISVRSYNAAAELVRHSAGSAIVDPWTAQQFHASEQIQTLALEPRIPLHVSILHAEHQPLSITAQQFIDQLTNYTSQ